MNKQLILQNDVQQVPLLSQFIDELCETVGLDMATTMNLNLAIEEAVVNVMNYAYPQGTVGDVFIDTQIDDKQLEFTISDCGTPFDPTTWKEADITLSAEDRPIGGLGIHLVKTIMDSVEYKYSDGKNMLTLIKRLA